MGVLGPGSSLEALVRKTTYAPMIYTALYVLFFMLAYPLLGQVRGGSGSDFKPMDFSLGTGVNYDCFGSQLRQYIKNFAFQL